jgi:hypothetical protein
VLKVLKVLLVLKEPQVHQDLKVPQVLKVM